jgi:hypothetical protein
MRKKNLKYGGNGMAPGRGYKEQKIRVLLGLRGQD